MVIEVTVAVPNPEEVDDETVLGVLSHGKSTLKKVRGGLEIEPKEGSGDKTIIANAAVIVYINVP